MFVYKLPLIFIILISSSFSFSQEIFSELRGEDCPNDGGNAMCILWKKLDSEIGENKYKIYWINEKGEKIVIDEFADNIRLKSDKMLRAYYAKTMGDTTYHGVEITEIPGLGPIQPKTKAKFYIEYVTKTGEILKKTDIFEIEAKMNWFSTNLIYVLLFLIVFTAILLYYFVKGKKGKEIFIRKIAGLDAIDDAIGRATEMGRPILYCTGLYGVSSLATIAALSIFSQIIKKLAQYGTKILVPCYDPIVMAAAKEIAKTSYLHAGRPDLYRDQDIYFVTDSQFGYVANVNATMIREKTATNLYLGYFYAEALLLSETGAANRSIQIAGTTAVTQLPFFVVTCDYTLIGEELYAAGAYISKDPMLMSTLKIQDIFKILLFGAILFESIYNSFGQEFFKYIFYVVS